MGLLPFLDQSMKVRMRNYLRNAHKENLLPFLHCCFETSEMTAASYLIVQNRLPYHLPQLPGSNEAMKAILRHSELKLAFHE